MPALNHTNALREDAARSPTAWPPDAEHSAAPGGGAAEASHGKIAEPRNESIAHDAGASFRTQHRPHGAEWEILQVNDRERQRIGADLHNGLGQQLTGLACLLAALRDRLHARLPAEARQIDYVVRLANEATAQAGALARELCPAPLGRTDLVAALEDLAYQSQLRFQVACRFWTLGPPPEWSGEHAEQMVYIAQEAVHRAVRCGSAASIDISLLSHRHRHRLVVTDNGPGLGSIADREANNRRHLMHYRAALIGADLSLHSRPGRGSRLACNFTTPFYEHHLSDARRLPKRAAQTHRPAG